MLLSQWRQHIQTLLWGFLLSSNRVQYILSWILWADHLDGGERDDGLFISPHLLDRVARHLHGEGLLDRGAEHLHRPPPGLRLPAAGAQASHCWLLISPLKKKGKISLLQNFQPVSRWCENSPGIVAFWVISSLHLDLQSQIKLLIFGAVFSTWGTRPVSTTQARISSRLWWKYFSFLC